MLQFSKAARRVLAEPDEGSEDGAGIPDEMLMAGTEPVEDNFRTFIVIPSGIRLHFQPYQVAPWAAGPQTVDVSLDELQAAQTQPGILGRRGSGRRNQQALTRQAATGPVQE